MSWAAVATGIRALLTADTGSGGLFNSGSELINAVYVDEAAENADVPFLVLTHIAPSEEFPMFNDSSEAIEYEFQAGVYTNKDVGLATHGAIQSRVRTVLRRQTPTVSGGWRVSKIESGGEVDHQTIDDFRSTADSYSIFISK